MLFRSDWNTPANILEKVIEYEAVHAISDWQELRRRMLPRDRRCFAFFHPAMPEESLIFVEVALCRGIPSSVQDLLSEDREPLHENEIDTAVFYSISNCQDGLKGISFGNLLIKQVVEELARDVPHLKRFVTLSPVPGFARWLAKVRASATPQFLPEAVRETLTFLDNPNWPDNQHAASEEERVLLPLAARYFLI